MFIKQGLILDKEKKACLFRQAFIRNLQPVPSKRIYKTLKFKVGNLACFRKSRRAGMSGWTRSDFPEQGLSVLKKHQLNKQGRGFKSGCIFCL